MRAISCWTICTTKSSRGIRRNMFSSNARTPQVFRAGYPCARSRGRAASLPDRALAEFRTDIVDGALDRRAARRGLVQKIGRIAFCGRAGLAEADAEQAIGSPQRFTGEKDAPDAKDHIGQLRRALEGRAPRLDAKR